MKKYFLAATAALLMLSISVSAQNTEGKEKSKEGQRTNRERKWSPKEHAEMMDKQLDLSDDQVSQLQALFEKQEAKRTEKREAVNSKSGEEKTKAREEMKNNREKEKQAFEAEVEKIIGKEKADKWKSLKKERQGKNGKNANGKRNRENKEESK